jgi:hypothetical protein
MIWVNELHYDNDGADTGEFFEIATPSSFLELSSVTLTLYNGNNGTDYGSHTLDTFVPGSTSGDYTFYNKSISGLQNGAPDGFSLDLSGSVLQFLSYEGDFTASSGPASGLNSLDIGVAQTTTSPVGSSLGLTGSGAQYDDFEWTAFSIASPGALNSGQSFTAVPEPRQYALVGGLFLLGFAVYRRLKTQPAS